ncbi:MAG: TlpA family protein disulfide reductase [Clostridia bacterium]|nr:TlpA family protein disulfide reductase [Oscillospiraceae bacterium]MBQ7005873.1 TlpA family protein disulfide reductase [Clostridia bacterium]
MKKKILSILLAALMLLSLAACGGNNATDGNATNGNATDGDVTTETPAGPTPFFPEFTTTGLDGEEYDQDIFKGNKLTMVNVWGTYCPPCIKEMPDLEKLSKDYADKGLVIIGIVSDTYDYTNDKNSDEKIKAANEIVAETGVTYLNLLPSDSFNKAKLDYIRGVLPTTYFLDENGELVTGEYIASRSYDQWASIIDAMFEEVQK